MGYNFDCTVVGYVGADGMANHRRSMTERIGCGSELTTWRVIQLGQQAFNWGIPPSRGPWQSTDEVRQQCDEEGA